MATKSIDVLFINPPFLRVPVDYDDSAALSRFEMDAMNPGILSMAAFLRSLGYTYRIIDLYRVRSWAEVRSIIECALGEVAPAVVGISNLSAYDYKDVLSISRFVKECIPGVFLVVGGQHASGLGVNIFRDSASIDAVAIGEGEATLAEIVLRRRCDLKLNDIPGLHIMENGVIQPAFSAAKRISLDEIPSPDFSEYPNARTYTPYIEEGRGCHLKCGFCNNSEFYGGGYSRKSKEKWRCDIDSAVKYFGNDALFAILTSNFGYKNAAEKLSILGEFGVRWATQMSCDVPWYNLIDKLGDAGMFMLNMGVESGSPLILQRMRKTSQPIKYLENARRILSKIKEDERIKSRINIVIYPSDTHETVAETEKWLEAVSGSLDSIICCVPVAFPGSELSKNIDEFSNNYGTKKIVTEYTISTHHFPLHPSKDISFRDATHICLRMEEKFSPARLYTVRHNYKTYEAAENT